MYLLLTGNAGVLLNIMIFLLLFLLVFPLVAGVALRAWIRSNILQSSCPTCGSRVQVARRSAASFRCNYCGSTLKMENGVAVRAAPHFQGQPGPSAF